MAKTPFDYQLEILLKEWDYAQSHIGRFDTIIFSIRSWAVSAFTAMLAVAATQGKPALMLLAIIPTMMFWLIEAFHKSFQRLYILRTREIEYYLASETFRQDAAAQTAMQFRTPTTSERFHGRLRWDRLRDIVHVARFRNVMVTYVSIIILCLLTFVFLSPDAQLALGFASSG